MGVKSTVRSLIMRVLRGEDSTESLIKKGLTVGKNLNRLGGVIIDTPHCWLITIGDDVTLASRVYILAHDASTKRHLGYTKVGRVTIGNKVFVGANSIILPNVNIGDNAIIGAGSVVTRDVPANSVVAGNHAVVVSSTDDYINKNKDLMNNRPVFDVKWTVNGGISEDMKNEMKDKLSDGVGYVE